MRTSTSQKSVQGRRGFLRAFAVLAGGAAVTTVALGRSDDHPARAPERTPARSAERSAQRYRTPSAPVLIAESPVLDARRINVAPTSIPSVRL